MVGLGRRPAMEADRAVVRRAEQDDRVASIACRPVDVCDESHAVSRNHGKAMVFDNRCVHAQIALQKELGSAPGPFAS